MTSSICGIIEINSREGGEWSDLALARLTEGCGERELPGGSREARFGSSRFTNWQFGGDSPTFLAANLAQMQSDLEAEFLRFQNQG